MNEKHCLFHIPIPYLEMWVICKYLTKFTHTEGKGIVGVKPEKLLKECYLQNIHILDDFLIIDLSVF